MNCSKLPRLLLIAFILISAFTCKRKESRYVYYEKWRISLIYNPNRLKGEPVEVREITYNSPEDTSFNVPGEPSYSQTYYFDRSGNMIRMVLITGPSVAELNRSYGPAGPGSQSFVYGSLDGKTSGDESSDTAMHIIGNSVTEQIAEDTFKTTYYSYGKYQAHFIVSFSQDGKMVKEEGWLQDNPGQTTIKYYEKDKLVKLERLNDGMNSMEKYYYSEKGFLDSIVSFDFGIRSGGTIYKNNERGDCVLFIETNKDSITRKKRMRYEYDEKGNWIKQLTFSEIDNAPRALDRLRKFPGYSIVIREIKY